VTRPLGQTATDGTDAREPGLAQIIAFSEAGDGKSKGPASSDAGPLGSLVAGRGFEPLTFRL
jgi:hypothetical protein